MRIRKRIVSVFLIFTILCGAVTGLSFQSGALAQDCLDTLENLADTQAFRATLEQGLANCESDIDISKYKIAATEDNRNAMSAFVQYYMPEYFHVNSMSFARLNGIYYTIKPNYDTRYNTAAKYRTARQVLDSEVNALLEGIAGNSALGDEQKALLAHDRLITYLHYDMGAYTNTVDPDSFSMAGVFFKQTAVCNGYCMAYYYLLKELGMRCLVVNSPEMNHAWNIAFIDGVPYYVDCTWDDPTYSFEGTVKHTNFLRSFDGLVETGHNKTDYQTDLAVDNTKYDEYYWQSSETAFELIGNELYFIDNETAQLKKASSQEVLCSVADRWMPDASHYYFDNYAKLTSDGNALFYNSSDSVYKYNLKTGKTTKLFTPDTSAFGDFYNIYGLTFADNVFTCYFLNNANYNPDTVENYAVRVPYARQVTLSALVNANEGSVNGEGSFYPGETVTVEAAAKPGYLFKAFMIDGTLLGEADGANGNTLTFTIQEDTEITVLFEACTHPNTESALVKPDCENEGYTLVRCPDCSYEAKINTVPALGHNFGAWSLQRAASCSKEGVEQRVCSRNAAHVQTRAVAKLPHTPADYKTVINEKKATCDLPGSYDLAILCTECGEAVSKTTHTTAALGHLYGEWTITAQPTCSHFGELTRVCARDASHKETQPIAKLDHTPKTEAEKANEVPATCTAAGSYEMVIVCSKCGIQLSSKKESTPALGHHYSVKTTLKPTAYKPGYTLNKCSRCEQSFKNKFTAPTGKVKGFKCKTRAATTQTLSWSRVVDAAGYQLQISTKDGKKWASYATYPTDASAVKFTGLVAGSPYKFRIRFFFTDTEGTLSGTTLKKSKKTIYSPWITITSPTLPKGTTLSKLSPGSKAFTAQWKKNTAVNGYRLQYSLKSNFSGAKTLTIKNAKTLKATVKKLRAKKYYYVRICTYKTISKVNYYSAWSKTYKVKTR